MRKSKTRGVVAILIAAMFMLGGCGARSDVNLARHIMTQLASGRYTIRHQIDWPNLFVLSKDVGAEYRNLPNDKEREGYEIAFIEAYKRGFHMTGASMAYFVNWRLFHRKAGLTIAVADMQRNPGYKLLVAVKNVHGKRKLVDVKAVHIKDAEKFKVFQQEMLK